MSCDLSKDFYTSEKKTVSNKRHMKSINYIISIPSSHWVCIFLQGTKFFSCWSASLQPIHKLLWKCRHAILLLPLKTCLEIEIFDDDDDDDDHDHDHDDDDDDDDDDDILWVLYFKI